MSEAAPTPYRASVDTIETAYEFLLAYAAQGRDREGEAGRSGIRGHLGAMREGLSVIVDQAKAEASSLGGDTDPAFAAFLEVFAEDARIARTKAELVLAAPVIGSQLVDNFNASVHVRALLTDLFLLDEFLKAVRRA